MNPDRLAELLRGTPRWRHLECVAETGSTNRDVAEAVAAGAEDGLVRIAEHQTGGRGRFDRVWETPRGGSVAMSAMVRTERPLVDWTWLPLLTGVAVIRAIRSLCDAEQASQLVLKWPNDVLVTGEAPGKVCGILCERHDGPAGAAAVIGIGLNVALDAAELPVDTASSLRLAGIEVDRTELVAAVLRELDLLLGVWEQRGHVREACTAVCASIGARLQVHLSETETVSGVGDSIDEQGRLVVRTPEGLRAFSAGDVVHLRPGVS